MSVDWFFIRQTKWLKRRQTIGPISEPDLLSRIDSGEIAPETLVRSTTKTRNEWIQMRRVPPAMRRYLQNKHGDFIDE